MSYFLGINGSGGFGGGGNAFSQLGELGPAWQNTMMRGLATQNALRNFQDNEQIRPFEIANAQEQLRLQQLQNYNQAFNQHQLAQAYLNSAYVPETPQQAQNAYHNMGLNYNTVTQQLRNMLLPHQANVAVNAPVTVQPTQSAAVGDWARTAPQIGGQRGIPSMYERLMGYMAQSNVAPEPTYNALF